MTRPSQHSDEKLVAAALKLLPITGYSRLSMRAVAAKAGVNLGMFHYHFKNKEEFSQRVAAQFYAEFFKRFTLEIETGKNPKEQLRRAIITLAGFARDNRRMLVSLGRDILEGEHQLVRVLESLIPRHGVILCKLINACKRQGYIANLPLPMIMTFLVGSVAGPILIMTILEQVKLHSPLDIIKKVGFPFLLADHVIEQRVDLALRALEMGTGREMPPTKIDRKLDIFVAAMESKNRIEKAKEEKMIKHTEKGKVSRPPQKKR